MLFAAGGAGAVEGVPGSVWPCFRSRIWLICWPILSRAAGSLPPYLICTTKLFLPFEGALDAGFVEAFGRGGEPRVPVFGLYLISFFALLHSVVESCFVGVSSGFGCRPGPGW